MNIQDKEIEIKTSGHLTDSCIQKNWVLWLGKFQPQPTLMKWVKTIFRNYFMKKTINFSQGKRGSVLPKTNTTAMTIHINSDVLEAFRERARKQGKGLQTLINDALKKEVSEYDCNRN